MNRKKPPGENVDKGVSLAPLDVKDALSGLLAIPDPDATKPKYEKEKRKRKGKGNE